MKRRRLGLRARVIVAFAIGAFLLSGLLSAVTYSLVRNNLVEAEHERALSNASVNAQTINDRITSATDDDLFIPQMEPLPNPPRGLQAMVHTNEWYFVEPLLNGPELLNEHFKTELLAGNPSEMTHTIRDELFYVVGFALPSAQANAYYVQATPVGELENTLNSLALALLAASAVATIFGMGFGIYTTTRLFSPIGEISHAAEMIASGDLSTRLDDGGDPDLDQLVQSFNDMTSALEERIIRDSRFASDVSHELRSPLMTLTGSVAVLERRREEMPERAKIALDLLSTDIRRFKVLVEDLLEISRFDVGAVQLEIEEAMLDDFVGHAIRAGVGPDSDVPIIHEGTEGLIVEIDKRRIAQVIRNLCENAHKYADGVTQVRLTRDGDDVRIELEDEGPGVPVDERELIFERFSRGSEGGKRGTSTGVGLGLSLVVEHLRLHGGTIHVTDRADGLLGARFVISLPGVAVDE